MLQPAPPAHPESEASEQQQHGCNDQDQTYGSGHCPAHENEGGAARILLNFDAGSEKIRNEVIRMLSMSSPQEEDADTMRAQDGEDDVAHSGAASAPAFPELGTISDTALDDLIDELLEQERAISYAGESCTARSTS